MDGFGQQVPKDEGSYGEGSISLGLVLGFAWGSEEVCFSQTETRGWRVAVKQGGEVAGVQIVEGVVGKEEDFEVDALVDWGPMEFMKDRGNVELLRCECSGVY